MNEFRGSIVLVSLAGNLPDVIGIVDSYSPDEKRLNLLRAGNPDSSEKWIDNLSIEEAMICGVYDSDSSTVLKYMMDHSRETRDVGKAWN